MTLHLNDRAWSIADAMSTRAGELRIDVSVLENGARVIDAGIAVPGGIAAGLELVALCMGGVGHVSVASLRIAGDTWPGVHVWTDHPAESCMASQYAGWAVNPPGYFAMGSGPLRAIARVERELFAKLAYQEEPARGVLVLETRFPPTADVAAWIAAKAGIAPDQLTLAVAPTASLAGGIQIVARVLETGLHKMDAIGFDVKRVSSAFGTAPLPPTARNDVRAIGRTNDCILYGGQARYVIDGGDSELAELARTLPALSSSDYGRPFFEIFERYGRDFYRIDPLLFSPAEVWLTSPSSGHTFHGGRLDAEVLRKSLYGT